MYLLPAGKSCTYQTTSYVFVGQGLRHWLAEHDKNLGRGIVINCAIRHSDMAPHYIYFHGGGFQPIPDYYIDIESGDIRHFGFF